jgi:hypothetical protein
VRPESPTKSFDARTGLFAQKKTKRTKSAESPDAEVHKKIQTSPSLLSHLQEAL